MIIYIVTQNFPPRIGGIQTVMHSVASQLALNGNKVHVFPDHFYPKNDSFKVTHLMLPKFLRPSMKKIFLSIIGDYQSLVFCDSWKSVNAVPKHFNNIVVFAHGQEYLNFSKNQSRIYTSLSRTKILIASSIYTLDLIKKNWDISTLKSSVIYPTYHIKKEPINNKILNQTGVVKIVSVCRIEKRKGLLESLKALNIINKKGYDFSWDIIGDGPQLNELKSLCDSLNIKNNVIFHGKINDNNIKETFVKESDIFLMPTYQDDLSIEGFGLAYIEAAKFCVPSIAGISGGAPEAVINKKTGWCVDPLDQHSLINVLEEALTSSNIRINLGNTAFKRFETELTSDTAIKKLMKIAIEQ